jgi:hypothetical protein
MVFRLAAEARPNPDANADPAPANHNPCAEAATVGERARAVRAWNGCRKYFAL